MYHIGALPAGGEKSDVTTGIAEYAPPLRIQKLGGRMRFPCPGPGGGALQSQGFIFAKSLRMSLNYLVT
jgi:hypothetical protein